MTRPSHASDGGSGRFVRPVFFVAVVPPERRGDVFLGAAGLDDASRLEGFSPFVFRGTALRVVFFDALLRRVFFFAALFFDAALRVVFFVAALRDFLAPGTFLRPPSRG